MKEKIAKIVWIDATHYGEISEKDIESLDLMKNITVGFVIRNDNDKIIIAMEKTLDEKVQIYRNVTVVPKKYIEEIKFLTEIG